MNFVCPFHAFALSDRLGDNSYYYYYYYYYYSCFVVYHFRTGHLKLHNCNKPYF